MFEMTTVVEWAAALGTISAACGIIVRAVTKDVVNSVQAVGEKHDAYAKAAGEKYEDLKHALKNQTARIDAIEHLRTSDVERIVKLESAVQSFDKAIERVERGQDKLTDMITDRFDTLAQSIREIRTVTPKG